VAQLRQYRDKGAYICLYTARNMRTHNGNLGKIMAHTSRTLFAWLEKHDIPFDEVYFGKPWPGERGFYVDDRTIRPSEFVSMTLEEIEALLAKEHEPAGSGE
jgi:capsule biosynthesis phosphatase